MEASTITPVCLQEVFTRLPEVRQARGRRHPLLAILNLTAVALLTARKSLQAIAPFARDHGPPLAEALGFTHGPTPCKTTLSNVFRRLEVAASENALSIWLKQRCPDLGDTIAIVRPDGQGQPTDHEEAHRRPVRRVVGLFPPTNSNAGPMNKTCA